MSPVDVGVLVLFGPLGGVGGGWLPVECPVGPAVIVFVSPVFYHCSGFCEVGEVLGVEAFVSEPSVE